MDRFLSPQNEKCWSVGDSRLQTQKSCFKFLKIAVKIKCSLQFTPIEQRLTKV